MKELLKSSIILCTFAVSIVACTRPAPKQKPKESPLPVKYENELFSINLPKGWTWDASGWKGLDSLQNEVDIYDPEGAVVSFHFVKTFMPIQYKNIDEATDMAKSARGLAAAAEKKRIDLIDEIDSVEVSGYPTNILFFANYEDKDTIIQKQFVTYLQDSHIVVYFNELFYSRDRDMAQKIGDAIISTIKLKKVVNPLEQGDNMKKLVKKEFDH